MGQDALLPWFGGGRALLVAQQTGLPASITATATTQPLYGDVVSISPRHTVPAARSTLQRNLWILLNNVLWVAWGAHTSATALVVTQFCLAALNIRAAMKARPAGTF